MEKKEKYKRLINGLVIVILVLVILNVFLSVFGFSKVFNFILKFDYPSFAAIITGIALIYTIIYDRKERSRLIDSNI